MRIIKKSNDIFKREDAHAGSGGRKLYIAEDELKNFQGMTYGYLPSGSKFAWHSHNSINEVMVVLKGSGIVRDKDGEYKYNVGDVFIFPKNVEHEIENLSNEEHEYIFVRVKE
jgi:quercetin dioxygenase-like cupin family protein